LRPMVSTLAIKRICLGLLLGAWVFPCLLSASETVYSAAGRANPVDNMGGGVRSVAMGSAYVAVSDDPSAVTWNPAGLAFLRSSELLAQHGAWFGTNKESVYFGLPLPKAGTLGVAGGYVDYGSFDGRGEDGAPLGSYSANQLDLSVGWGGYVSGRLAVGAQVHAVQQTLAEKSASLFTGGMGVMAETPTGWRLGAAFMNGGLTKESVSAEASFRAGLSRRWTLRKGWALLTAAGGNISPRAGNSFQLGCEADFMGAYFLRAGYHHRTQDPDLEGLFGPSFGLGFSRNSISVDYAFAPYGELGQAHQFALRYRFGKEVVRSVAAQERTATPTPTPLVVMVPVTVYLPLPMMETPVPSGNGQVAPEAVTSSAERKSGELVLDFEEAPQGLELARQLVKERRPLEAIRVYNESLQKDPRDAKAWWELGQLYYQAGHQAYAVSCFEKVLVLQPGNQALAAWLERYKAGSGLSTP